MAEHPEAGVEWNRDKSLGSSLSSGDLPRNLSEASSKSPGENAEMKEWETLANEW